MAGPSFFSGNAKLVVGILLALALLYLVYNVGGVALNRWFGG